jgi:NitT/TauT family transport system ATP-binding protein
LLRIVAGLDTPTSGSLRLTAPAVADRPFNSMVFQGDSTLPWLTVYANVEYGLRMRGLGLKARDEIVSRMLRTVGLSRFAEAYPYQLSGGMRQRVALARALANDPEVLLMDEPFGALDEMTRERLNNELLDIWSKMPSMTVLFVTHNIAEAVYLSSRVVVMSPRPGRITGIIDIDLPRPRTTDTLDSDQFFRLTNEVRHLLREGIG